MKIVLNDNGKILSNKGMGWVTHVYCGEEKDYNEVDAREYIDNVALLYTWAQIEKEEGVFDFSAVDAKVDYHTSRGQYIHFRISTDPMIYNGAFGVPNYVFDKYGVKFFERDDYGCVARFPDYLDENYLFCLKRFLNAFKEHYRDNTYVLQVDLRGYGEWGEWHSGYLHETLEEHNRALRNIIEIWSDCFSDTDIPLALSSSYEWRSDLPLRLYAPKSYEEYRHFQGFDDVEKYDNVTFRRDGVGGAVRIYDKQIIDECYFSDKRHGITAEYFGGYLKFSELPDGNRGYHVEDAVEEGLCLHPNYMMLMWDSNQFYEARPDLIRDVALRIGFRLIPEETDIVRDGDRLCITQLWKNLGVGKYPFRSKIDWKVVIDGVEKIFVDRGFDAHILHKDETTIHSFVIPDIKDDNYELYFRLSSDKGDLVNLPVDCHVTADGFYRLV